MTDSLGQGRHLPEDFRWEIARADLLEASCQYRSPIQQSALAHERGRHPDPEGKKCVLPVYAAKVANTPVGLPRHDAYQP